MTPTPPSATEFRFAEAIVDSDAVLRTFAAVEWDCLDDDGKTWATMIIREALRIASYVDATSAIDRRLSEIQGCPPEGYWKSCTGCHETSEGYSVGVYPYSAAMKCELGSGCRECGGIGAIWDDTDWADFAEFSMALDRDHRNIEQLLIEQGGLPVHRADELATAITALEIPERLRRPTQKAGQS